MASERRGLVDEARARTAWARKEDAMAGRVAALAADRAKRRPIIMMVWVVW